MNKLTDYEIIDSVLKGNENDFALIIDRYKDRQKYMRSNVLVLPEQIDRFYIDRKVLDSLGRFFYFFGGDRRILREEALCPKGPEN